MAIKVFLVQCSLWQPPKIQTQTQQSRICVHPFYDWHLFCQECPCASLDQDVQFRSHLSPGVEHFERNITILSFRLSCPWLRLSWENKTWETLKFEAKLNKSISFVAKIRSYVHALRTTFLKMLWSEDKPQVVPACVIEATLTEQ